MKEESKHLTSVSAGEIVNHGDYSQFWLTKIPSALNPSLGHSLLLNTFNLFFDFFLSHLVCYVVRLVFPHC